MLDLAAAIAHIREADPRLRALLDASPCSFARLATPAPGTAFSQLARTIVGQQLHDKAAEAIYLRVAAAAAGAGAASTELTPAALLAAPDAALLAAGLSRAKLRALRDLAGRFADARLSERMLAHLADDAQLAAALTQVVGVGAWTVHMFLIFSLKRLDVLPTGDLAVRKGFLQVYGAGGAGGSSVVEAAPRLPRGKGGGGLPSAAQMEAIAERWRPFRSLGACLMWHAVGIKPPVRAAAPAAPLLVAAWGGVPPAAALCDDSAAPATPARALCAATGAARSCAAPRKARTAPTAAAAQSPRSTPRSSAPATPTRALVPGRGAKRRLLEY